MQKALTFAPGNVVEVRDEEWLITSIDESADGPLLNVEGLSDLVRGQDADFYPSIDQGITINAPRDVRVRPDDSPKYRRSRPWAESTVRKTAVPLSDDSPEEAAVELRSHSFAHLAAIAPGRGSSPGVREVGTRAASHVCQGSVLLMSLKPAGFARAKVSIIEEIGNKSAVVQHRRFRLYTAKTSRALIRVAHIGEGTELHDRDDKQPHPQLTLRAA